MVGRETMRLAGRSHVRENVAGVSFLVSPTTFFQTNVEAAEVLLRLVFEATPNQSGQNILDLYAGSGLFTLPLAASGHRVTAIEENAQAMRDADSNLRLNRISPANVRLLTASVEEGLKRVRRESFDLVVLDPPRSGCTPSVIRTVFGQLRAPRVVYVSCNPEALASELPSILGEGYRVNRVQPVDMFPHTTHIETVVTLDLVRQRRTKSARGNTAARQ
jgi:23S rRNA (uracil1939-C5)-methyltransferase